MTIVRPSNNTYCLSYAFVHFRHHQMYNAYDAVHELDVVATK